MESPLGGSLPYAREPVFPDRGKVRPDRRQPGGPIQTSTRYILCTRNPGRHRKAVEVCRQCRHRSGCKDFHEAEDPGLTRNLDKLQGAMDRLRSRPDVASRFKEELTAIRALC